MEGMPVEWNEMGTSGMYGMKKIQINLDTKKAQAKLCQGLSWKSFL